MIDEHPNPLLTHISITIPPHLALPLPIALPYSYTSLQSTLPPSQFATAPAVSSLPAALPSINPPSTSDSNIHAEPSPPPRPPRPPINDVGLHRVQDILKYTHVTRTTLNESRRRADRAVHAWQQSISDRDLALRRKVAPGWLDSNQRLLLPDSLWKSSSSSSACPDSFLSAALDTSAVTTACVNQTHIDKLDNADTHVVINDPDADGKAIDRFFGTPVI